MSHDSLSQEAQFRIARASARRPGTSAWSCQQPIVNFNADGITEPEAALLKHMNETGAVFMMGQNPKLPVMPERPKLLDFFHYRFCDIAFRHLLQSAKLALDAGQSETVVIACLLHDISNGALLRTDHGYWGAQMIAPYVSEEVAWAVQVPPGAALLRR